MTSWKPISLCSSSRNCCLSTRSVNSAFFAYDLCICSLLNTSKLSSSSVVRQAFDSCLFSSATSFSYLNLLMLSSWSLAAIDLLHCSFTLLACCTVLEKTTSSSLSWAFFSRMIWLSSIAFLCLWIISVLWLITYLWFWFDLLIVSSSMWRAFDSRSIPSAYRGNSLSTFFSPIRCQKLVF